MPVESHGTSIDCIPNAEMLDTFGDLQNLRDLTDGSVSVIFFSCNHCPYVRWVEQVIGRISQEAKEAVFIAVCSNDVSQYPEDDIPGLTEQSTRAHWNFPYLLDSTQTLAKTFGAVCTPDFFVFDVTGSLVYRGAADESRPNGDLPATGVFLEQAIQSAASGQTFRGGRPSLGCGIKWLNS